MCERSRSKEAVIRRVHGSLIVVWFFIAIASSLQATEVDLLPPVLPWDGASRSLLVEPEDRWITPAERNGLISTPRYEDTVSWLEGLAEAAPQLNLVSLGRSHEGREIWMVVASAEGAASPEALRENGRPTLLAHSGIHSGEIDGKDAGMMLLRDMTVRGTARDLLAKANLLFIPILNVDGHERFSRWGRINQRGPEEMGWRTNARNLNLNRDFTKLETPELQALVAAFNLWRPDLWLDLHVTDGIDYQYDITFGFNGASGWSPATGRWLEERLRPALEGDLERNGHVPGPLVFAANRRDLSQGIVAWTANPRYSNGYADARHLPGVLVENHSLKPYDQRVLGTRVLLASAMALLGEWGGELRDAVIQDQGRRAEEVALAWKVPDDQPPSTIRFKGIERRQSRSSVSGGVRTEWTGNPVEVELPVLAQTAAVAAVRRPTAYWIPPAWDVVVERLALHGVLFERLEEARGLEVEMYRLEDVELEDEPFEGRVRVSAKTVPERRTEVFPAGSVRVPADQPLGDLAVLLLEPESPDSFFQWGYFLEILQRTEYFESYVMEPLAERMLADDPELAAEFDSLLLSDPDFAGSARQRLHWFYERTPYFDGRWRLYPVAREIEPLPAAE